MHNKWHAPSVLLYASLSKNNKQQKRPQKLKDCPPPTSTGSQNSKNQHMCASEPTPGPQHNRPPIPTMISLSSSPNQNPHNQCGTRQEPLLLSMPTPAAALAAEAAPRWWKS